MADKKWTVMVYISGDNNLSDECVWSLKEMYRAGLRDEIALVVQMDPRAKRIQHFDIGRDLAKKALAKKDALAWKNKSAPSTLLVPEPAVATLSGSGPGVIGSAAPTNGSGDGLLDSSKIIGESGSSAGSSEKVWNSTAVDVSESHISSDMEDGGLLSRAKALEIEKDNMASSRALTKFIKETKEQHPATYYMLILSGHGSGVIGNSFLTDGFPRRALSIRKLNKALTDGDGVDILGMDACGMGMVEVGYEVRKVAKYLVAAEGFELNTGWPYHNVLGALNENPAITPRALAARIVTDYTAYYSDFLMAGVSTDLAACHLEKTGALVDAVKALATLLKGKLPDIDSKNPYVESLELPERALADAIILAHWRAQSYRFEEYTDLWDFCDLLAKGCSDKDIVDACKEVIKAIEGTNEQEDGTLDGYVLKSCRSGGTFQHSHGVAIYFPWKRVLRKYRKLSFAENSEWDEFLETYVKVTRRKPRSGSGPVHSVPQSDDLGGVVRDFPELHTRDFPELHTRGLAGILPDLKNSPNIFFEDTCGQPGHTPETDA